MKSWDELNLEEKREELREMADLLEKGLDAKKVLSKKGGEKVREITRPFFEAIRRNLKEKGIDVTFAHDFTEAKKIRDSFDYFNSKGIRVHLALNVKDEKHIARKSLWWGYCFWGRKEKTEEERKWLEQKGLKGEVVEVEGFGGQYLIHIKGWRSAAQLRKEKSPDSLIEEITNDLIDLHQKIYGEELSGKGNKGEDNLKPILNAINTKPFIILSGISGTGKTQIARIISAGVVSSTKKGD